MSVTLHGRFTINVEHDIKESVMLNTVYCVNEGWWDYSRALRVQETWSSKHFRRLSFFFLSFGANDYYLAVSTNQTLMCKLMVTHSMLTRRMLQLM